MSSLHVKPTPDSLREFMQRHNLTGSDVGKIVGVGSRAVRRWTGGFRSMPAAAWILLQIWGGEVSVDELQAMPARQT